MERLALGALAAALRETVSSGQVWDVTPEMDWQFQHGDGVGAAVDITERMVVAKGKGR
jgi:hypothetical protein